MTKACKRIRGIGWTRLCKKKKNNNNAYKISKDNTTLLMVPQYEDGVEGKRRGNSVLLFCAFL